MSSSSGIMQSAQFMGLLNALRTGDPTVDTIAAFLLPFALQKVATHVPGEAKKLLQWICGPNDNDKYYNRNIEYRTTDSLIGENVKSNDDALNMYLVRAINLYVHRHCDLGQLHDAKLKLSMLDTTQCGSNTYSGTARSHCAPSIEETLKKCSLVEKAGDNRWVDVGEYDGGRVYIKTFDNVQGTTGGEKNQDSSIKTRIRGVQISSKTGPHCIHAFTRTAVDWYANELRAEEDKDRFFFDFQYASDQQSRPHHTPYKLSDGKTFKTLFSHKCQNLLPIVDHFQDKTGKYAIDGYPHKLGLLLTGIPGTGKTSLIKALAHYTRRHIVNVNLANVPTNTTLRKIFFNKKYHLSADEGDYKNFGFDQVIFVLEDVDAGARDVIMDRAMLAKARSEGKDKQETGNENATFVQSKDKLNLSGLLNVLDGVVETPGRMVIMTTNYPEILDPALIRPGRIDKILELGYMDNVDDIVQMLEHYYPERRLTDEEREKIAHCLSTAEPKTCVTPAQMEQLAMEQDDLAGFLEQFFSFGKDEKVQKNTDNDQDTASDRKRRADGEIGDSDDVKRCCTETEMKC